MKERGQIIDLEDEIYINHFQYSKDLKNSEIGIKSLPFHKNGFKSERIALIKMILKIENGLLNRWEKNGRQGMVLHDLRIHNELQRFYDQIEQFILRGTDTKNRFAANDIRKDEFFNCFFHGHDKRYPIDLSEFKDLHEAVVNLEYDLRKEHYNPPFTLMSDSETLKWPKYKYTPDGRISLKEKIEERQDIYKWIDLGENADNSKGDDYNLVCIANRDLFNKPIKIIEKNPLNIVCFIDGIILYWVGALEVSENAIQQIRINRINA